MRAFFIAEVNSCGRPQPYTAAVTINGHTSYNNSVWLDAGPSHDASKLDWAQAQTVLNSGWDFENHSALHSAANPAQQISDLDALIANRLQGYRPSVHIVPTNYAGYPTAAFAAGDAAVSSNSQSDNLTMLNPNNSIAQDRLWVTTLREFREYRRLRDQVIRAISESVYRGRIR